MSTLDGVRSEALDYLRAGSSVGLVGLPGSGRTTILRAVTETLASTGWTVIEVQGLAGLADRPLEALAVAGLVGQAANRPRGTVAAAVDALRRALTGTRSVMVVDDADDLDPSSIGVISAAIGSRRVPLLSAVTTARRPSELSLPALVRPGVRLPVPPLAYEDSQEIVQQICGRSIHTSTVAVFHARAGGLPALVRAITENARRRGLLVQRNGMWYPAGDMWTPHLAQTMEPFVQGLTQPALDGLSKLAYVGAVNVEVADQLMPSAELEELDDHGVLSFSAHAASTVVSVYPPLLADHLSRERLGARRVRLIAEIAEALHGSGDGSRFAEGPITVANEFRQVHRPPQAQDTVDAESRVVTDAVLNRLVNDRHNAQVMARRAEWEQRQDSSSAIALALTLMVRGVQEDELEPVFATDIPVDDQRGRTVLASWQANYLAYAHGDLEGAIALLDKTAESVGVWAPMLVATGQYLTLFFDRVPSDPLPDISDELPMAESQRLFRAERLLAVGRPSDALDELDQMAKEDPDAEERASVIRGVALLLAGDLDSALAWSESRYQQGRSRFDPELITGHGYVVALAHLLRGDNDALRAHLGPLLSVGITPLERSLYQLGTLVIATRLASLSGRPLTARSLASQAAAMGLPNGPYPGMLVAQAEDHAALADGADASEVADRLWAAVEDLRERGYTVAAVTAGARCVEVCPDEQRAAEVMALADGADSMLLTLLARYAVALTADPEMQLQAGGELVAAGMAGFGIRLQVTAVDALRSSDPERATREGHRLGLLAERLGGSYRELIESVAPRSVLTSREREVAELASSGLSNVEISERLVVSVRTVENHLHRAFNKLGVQSRSDLTGALQDTG